MINDKWSHFKLEMLFDRDNFFVQKLCVSRCLLTLTFYIVFIAFRTAQIKYDAFKTIALFDEFQI